MKHQDGFSVVEGLLILIVVGIVGFTGWYVLHARKATDQNYKSSNSTAASSKSTKAPTTGTSDADLSADLSGANSSQGQTAQDSNQSTGAVNDQQQEITVPTN